MMSDSVLYREQRRALPPLPAVKLSTSVSGARMGNASAPHLGLLQHSGLPTYQMHLNVLLPV